MKEIIYFTFALFLTGGMCTYIYQDLKLFRKKTKVIEYLSNNLAKNFTLTFKGIESVPFTRFYSTSYLNYAITIDGVYCLLRLSPSEVNKEIGIQPKLLISGEDFLKSITSPHGFFEVTFL